MGSLVLTLRDKNSLDEYRKIKDEMIVDKVNEIFRNYPDNYIPVSEYFLAFAVFSPRITDLPTCLCVAPVCACLCVARRQVVCTDMGNALAFAVQVCP
ncbi:MAG: hypothetical protein JRE64_24315 [Deltaproteobacteria bacterium]|nr:hypothetical protein [Deltaproteobacteria bacterium]